MTRYLIEPAGGESSRVILKMLRAAVLRAVGVLDRMLAVFGERTIQEELSWGLPKKRTLRSRSTWREPGNVTSYAEMQRGGSSAWIERPTSTRRCHDAFRLNSPAEITTE